MNPGHPQGFIRIDVAQPGEERLIQQQGFDLPPEPLHAPGQAFRGESPVQRFRTEMRQNRVRGRDQGPTAELPGVHE